MTNASNCSGLGPGREPNKMSLYPQEANEHEVQLFPGRGNSTWAWLECSASLLNE